MYGQNLGGRPYAPGEPIFTKFCTLVRIPDVFLNFEFQKDRMKNVGAVGAIEKAHLRSSVTPDAIDLKFGTRDYVACATQHAKT